MVAIAIIVVIALVAIFMTTQKKKRTEQLRSKFGPEYDKAVTEHKDRAEEVLERRQERVEKYHLRPLRPEECDRFASEWRHEQERFVDDPAGAVAAADRLVGEAMTARGYRLPDIETRMEDLSVEHPKEVEHYRAAHELAQRSAAGQANTEDLRQAMQHYRTVFECLLGTRVNEPVEVRR